MTRQPDDIEFVVRRAGDDPFGDKELRSTQGFTSQDIVNAVAQVRTGTYPPQAQTMALDATAALPIFTVQQQRSDRAIPLLSMESWIDGAGGAKPATDLQYGGNIRRYHDHTLGDATLWTHLAGWDGLGGWKNPTLVDRSVTDAVISAASGATATVTSATAAFVATDVGQPVTVSGGTGGVGTTAKITAVTSATVATVTASAGSPSNGSPTTFSIFGRSTTEWHVREQSPDASTIVNFDAVFVSYDIDAAVVRNARVQFDFGGGRADGNFTVEASDPTTAALTAGLPIMQIVAPGAGAQPLTTWTGPHLYQSTADTQCPITIKNNSGTQDASSSQAVFRARRSDGTTNLLQLFGNGDLRLDHGTLTTHPDAGTIAFDVVQATSPTVDLFRVRNNGGTALFELDSAGRVGILQAGGTPSGYGAALNLRPPSTSTQGVIVRGLTSQTGDLIQCQQPNSSTVGFAVGPNGAVKINSIATPSTPAAGFGALYFKTGTNAGTVKLCALGPDGVEIVITDNI